MLVNTAIMSEVFQISLWNFLRLALMSAIFFYWVPRHIFPQTQIHNTLDRILFNIIYMLTFIMTTIPLLTYLHIFSMPLFLLLLLLLKAISLHYFDKQSLFERLRDRSREILIRILDLLDNFYIQWKDPSARYTFALFERFEDISYVIMARRLLTWSLFGYITYTLALGGFISYADAVPDTAQFVEWVASLNNNILFADGKTFGADFYGQATFVFFLQKITNIDSIVLFNIYPALLILFVLFGLYYVVYKVTASPYSALFSLILFGIVLLSPAADIFLGLLAKTDTPPLITWAGLKFYLSWIGDYTPEQIRLHLTSIAHVPYERYGAGLAYEFASSFFLLNIYFMSSWALTKKSVYLMLYGMTIVLMFTFHGGGAFYFVAVDLLIFFAAILFGLVDWKMFRRGILLVVLASILGNLWVLSMLKYGLPQDFGAAAPFLDTLFTTKQSVVNATAGGELVEFTVVNAYQISILFMLLLLPLTAIFKRRQFPFLALSLGIIAVIVIYFAPNLGLPRIAEQARAAEYLLLSFAVGGGLYFSLLVVRPLRYFYRSYTKHLVLMMTFATLITIISITPRWIDSDHFIKQTNSMEYNDIALVTYQLSKRHRPYTWTTVSYVQSYPKALGKGFHINAQEFLLHYDPDEHYLKVGNSEWVYIFVENISHPFVGMDEWYYRWRSDIHEQLKLWIEHYQVTHTNISIYLENELVTVYKIDNRAYVDHLEELKKRKKASKRSMVEQNRNTNKRY